jgi:hypothetical protein
MTKLVCRDCFTKLVPHCSTKACTWLRCRRCRANYDPKTKNWTYGKEP